MAFVTLRKWQQEGIRIATRGRSNSNEEVNAKCSSMGN
ncbi:hypothetical protein T11_17999 [Trichinella zimbabwensis]|uniref:Uncharacterized protein n=1 Tax=Trichinella zimbabwensis TaxID=268475 RepID=A0A0V1GEE0_9BILA|nr:hypothetical protein T11_17999 [Trichinella zimbabwensis]